MIESMSARLLWIIACTAICRAQTLPGTTPLTANGDLALQMVDGIKQWLVRAAPRAISRRPADAGRLRYIIGAVDQRVPFDDLELLSTLHTPAERLVAPGFRVQAVRWPVL